MSSFASLSDFLRTAPGAISALVAMLLAMELLKRALKVPPRRIIHVLEFFAAVVVGGLMIHNSFGSEVGRSRPQINPTLFLIVFVCVIFGSGYLVIIDRKTR